MPKKRVSDLIWFCYWKCLSSYKWTSHWKFITVLPLFLNEHWPCSWWQYFSLLCGRGQGFLKIAQSLCIRSKSGLEVSRQVSPFSLNWPAVVELHLIIGVGGWNKFFLSTIIFFYLLIYRYIVKFQVQSITKGPCDCYMTAKSFKCFVFFTKAQVIIKSPYQRTSVC